MHKYYRLLVTLLSILLAALSLLVAASEPVGDPVMVIKTMPPESPNDVRHAYKLSILKAALDATVEQYGPYKIVMESKYLSSARAFRKLIEGKGINTNIGLVTKERDSKLIPIRYPLRRGLLNYRLLLVKKSDIDKFSNIQSLEDLKKYKVGLGNGWLTVQILEHHGFHVVTAVDRANLFGMLERRRFDYILLGANEIYKEIDYHQLEKHDLAVVPRVTVYINMPLYIFVNKKYTKIAARIEQGMQILQTNGELHRRFIAEYGEGLLKADLQNRKVIYLENPTLPDTVPASDSGLWLNPAKPLVDPASLCFHNCISR